MKVAPRDRRSNFHPHRLMDMIVFNEIALRSTRSRRTRSTSGSRRHAFLKESGVQIDASAPFAGREARHLRDELLRSMGTKHGKSVTQAILRWLVQRGVVVIPKSVRKDRMAENFAVLDFERRRRRDGVDHAT